MSPEQHLDLDTLTDVLLGDASVGAEEHAAGCAQCRLALEEVRVAGATVTARLAALPAVALPDDLAARLQDALRAEARSTSAEPADTEIDDEPAPPEVTTAAATVTPFPTESSRADSTPNPARWLAAAAAVVVLLAGGLFGIAQLRDDDGGLTSATGDAGGREAAAADPDIARNDSGADYTDRASLAAAVPDLLEGRRQAHDSAMIAAAPTQTSAQKDATSLTMPAPATAPDPLARLRDTKGLAECLLALLPPDDDSVQPLAVDYGSFRSRPAMVVVLPGAAANKLDIFVVGPACSRENDSVLFYTSVDRP